MAALADLRHQLDQILADAAAREVELDAREVVIAQALEHATADAVRAAWEQSRQYERTRVLRLIDAYSDARGAMEGLDSLKQMVNDA